MWFHIQLKFSKKLSNMTENEIAFCRENGHDLELASLIRSKTDNPIMPLPQVNDTLIDTKMGFCSELDVDGVICDDSALALKKQAAQKGYLVFVFDGDFAEDDEGNSTPYHHLAVLKGTDELDIIRWRQSDGCNYDIFADDIIAKLAKWRINNKLVVMGAGMDWVRFKFETLPNDMDAFAEELYEFCCDIVDQGTGTVTALKEEIVSTEGNVFLWWD